MIPGGDETRLRLTAEMLRGIDLFDELAPAERRRITKTCRGTQFAKGEQIVSYEDTTRDVLFVASGMVRATLFSPSGKEVTFRDLHPGQMFGALAAIDGKLQSASAFALTDVLVVSMTAEQFWDVLCNHPPVAAALLRELSGLVRLLTEHVVEFSTAGVRNITHSPQARDAELTSLHGELQWVSRINRAFEEKRFRIACQAILPLSASSDSGIHCEILVRIEAGDGSLILPGAFLPAAERHNLASKIDRWVISETFQWFAHRRHVLDTMEMFAINLSGQSLGEEDFLDFVIQQFEQTRIPREKVCFEITETTAIANISVGTRFIDTLKGNGCRFALDDFGSGLSSFTYLNTLPADFLKIDGSYVKRMLDDATGRAMVRSINEIGQALGKKTIAECVEHRSLIDQVAHLGVDFCQGYAVGLPLPLDTLEQGNNQSFVLE